MADNSYKSIVKGTAIFGGAQIFTILINLFRGKLVAMFLGPEGMGISSLFSISINTIQQFSSLGLNLSVVKEISSAKEIPERLGLVVSTVRKLLILTAALGSLFSILFSSYLSVWAFGTDEYRWHFVFLSVVVAFSTLSNGELSILQGFHAVKRLAFASIIGASIGLFIGVPLYYFYGYEGIVPAMIVLSLSTYLFYRFNTRKIKYQIVSDNNWKEQYPLAKKMISLGVVMMVASLFGTCANYLLNTFISHNGSVNDVGLFQAANSITNQYVGLVFTAMSLDFFPRLSAVSFDNEKIRKLVNKQLEVVVLVVSPIVILLIILSPVVIKLLLTDKFISLIPVIRWLGLAIFFKAVSFPLGYISFSKGDKNTFFWMEGVWGNISSLVLNCLFYFLFGIVGIGISFVISYGLYCLVCLIVTNRLYSFSIAKENRILVFILFLFVITSFVSSFIPNLLYSYSVMAGVLIVSVCYSLYELNKRVSILQFIKK